MLSEEDLSILRTVARRKAGQLSRHCQDREDLEQEALLAALRKPEFSTKAARWGAGVAARKQRAAARPRPPERHWTLHQERGRSGQFVPRGQGAVRALDVEAIKSLPTVRQVVDDLVRRALAACDGSTRLAAAAIGMGHTTLTRRLRSWRALGLDAPPQRTAQARAPAAARSSTE
jgi:DNA-directed RNA polymerase specialized sigma24 family protein